MSKQIIPITERQLDLITRAHCDSRGLIEPLLALKGGAKLKMIASLAKRALIEQHDGQWRITRAAIALVQGVLSPTDTTSVGTLPDKYTIPTFLEKTATPSDTPPIIANDPEIKAEVTAAKTNGQAERQLKIGAEGMPKHRPDSKQALVIEMLKRPEGATIAQISEITGWQAHTVRGTFSGALKKKLGLNITSQKPPQGERIYRG